MLQEAAIDANPGFPTSQKGIKEAERINYIGNLNSPNRKNNLPPIALKGMSRNLESPDSIKSFISDSPQGKSQNGRPGLQSPSENDLEHSRLNPYSAKRNRESCVQSHLNIVHPFIQTL